MAKVTAGKKVSENKKNSPTAAVNEKLMTQFRLSVFKLNGLLLKKTEDSLSDSKLTRSRNLVLGVLVRLGRPMTISQIATEMGQTRQGVGRLVGLLAQDGYLEMTDNPYHRNSKLAHITESGNYAYAAARESHEKRTREHPFPVDGKELEITCNVLNQVIEHLESDADVY